MVLPQILTEGIVIGAIGKMAGESRRAGRSGN